MSELAYAVNIIKYVKFCIVSKCMREGYFVVTS